MGCTKIIYDLLPEKLFMGYGEEQLSRTLTFDISQMQAELPGGVPMIAYMRPRDELGYLASGVTLEGSTLTWELSAHVMQYKGIGGAQIVLVDESGEETHILKSHVMQMLIGSSIPLTGGEPPEPWETWLEQILAAAARAESAAADAEVQADRAETAEAGAQQALIDAGNPVIYGRAQTLTDAQQQTARGNIAAASAAEVSDLKSAVLDGMAENIVDTDMWSINGINSVGSYSPATIRLATKRRISFPEFSKIETMGNYTINLGVWDASEKYIGKLQIDGTFGTTKDEGWVRSFDLTKYPNYSFVVLLRNESSPNSNMNISEAENCILRKDYISLEKTMNKIVGSDGVDVLLEWSSLERKAFSFPAEIKTGDVIRAEIRNFTAPCDITLVTVKDGVNQDALINAFAVQGVGRTVGAVATTDANAIKVYCSQSNVSFKVYRVIGESADYENLVEQNFKAKAEIKECESEILSLSDSSSYQILGENAITNNKDYVTDMTFKMVLLDSNYKYFSVANIKRIIDEMNAVGLNSLMLGFGGSGRGLCFKLDDMTIESYGTIYDLEDCISTSSGKYLTESDMQEIISYAKSKGIEILPYLGMPGHFAPFLVHQPQFRYQGDSASINIDDRQACDYAYKIAELYIKWFARHDIKYWVFGADEFGDIVNGYYNLHSSGNYNYAKFINEISYIVAKYRMIPMAWNDGFCIDGDIIPMLNRKVPVLYWERGNEHWASAEDVQKNGNELINSSYGIYYVVNGSQVTEEQMRAFNVHNFADGTVVANPKGACFCIWIGKLESPALDDDGNAITTAVLPLITAFGETIASQFN